jgi:hypothetical protein
MSALSMSDRASQARKRVLAPLEAT